MLKVLNASCGGSPSRLAMFVEAALDQKLGTLLRMHEEAFRQLGGVPEEILYDRMKTVWLKTDERGEIVWHPCFGTSRSTGDFVHGCADPIELRRRGRS